MHDLVHDLARLVMFDEIIVAGEDNNNGGSSSRYALLKDCSKPLESPKIRALRFMDCGETELGVAAFSSGKSLRILDLSECSIHELPNSVGLLKHLRYLNAPRVQHETIPDSITRLSKLTYLNLHGSSAISALPESIGDIEGLLYLDLSGCSGIEKLPESIGRLTKLVHMDLSNCSRLGDVSKFLGSLTMLQYLNLSHCPNIGELPADLGGMFELRYLNLSFSSYLRSCPEAEVFGTLTKLKYLNLSSNSCSLEKLPRSLGRFTELKYLNLSGCQRLEELPAIIGNLRELQYLNLSGCIDTMFPKYPYPTIDSLIDSISGLSNLEHLDLSRSLLLQSIPTSFCNLRKLHTLDLSRCPFLWKIPESIGTIDSLKFLYVDYLSDAPQLGSNAITLPEFSVHTRNGESSSNLVLLQHTDPVKLHITRLENVKTAEEAQSIKLIGKQRMTELELQWTRDAERFVDDEVLLEKLVPPSSLEDLAIQGYRCGSFPAWLMDITHYLPNLISIELCNLPNCSVLPPLIQLPNLDCLVLKGLESLEEWNVPYSSGEELVLGIVEIHDCPKLRIKQLPLTANWFRISNSASVLSSWGQYTGASTTSCYAVHIMNVERCMVPMHQWRLLQHLTGLTRLEINDCGDLTGSPEIIQHLSSLKSLGLQYSDQQELPKWLGELTSLKEMRISGCSGLTELPKNMTQLTELDSLEMRDCNNITSLPHWLGELTSLREFEIRDCDGISSLPEGIQQLTNLQELRIFCCPALKKWCELEENKVKLAHIKDKQIQDSPPY